MKYFLFYVALVLSFILTACGGEPPKESPGPPQPAPPAAPAAPAAPKKSLPKIIAFGDSLTAGFGLPVEASYPSLLQDRLNRDGFEYEVVNAGVSGDTSAGGVGRIDWALEGDVRVVILELGANDILRGQPIPAMKKNLGDIIERAKARGAQVLLAGMEAPTNMGIQYRKAAHDAYQSLAREHGVPLIPFFLDRVAGIESLNQSDRIHPNAEGTKVVAETVYKSLKPILEKQARPPAG
ncbi:MAG TPA: arylesterase [Blastocatellia bacterium]|jgi:acyl-CoA thioesterase-1|nr:arylesterase [Blastocatellia bacterium]